MKDTLTKKGFWDKMSQEYPKAMAHFLNWIDSYKKDNNWNKVFNSDSDWQDMHGKNAPAPKYHELPIAMQFGIFLEWLFELCKDPKMQLLLKIINKGYKESFYIMFDSNIRVYIKFRLKSVEELL